MQSVFEKIIEKLEGKAKFHMEFSKAKNIIRENRVEHLKQFSCYQDAIEIVKQAEAECKGGWIPCSERVPNNYQIHEVTAKYNETVYTEFAYYDGVKDEWWKHDDDELVNVIAWKENSEPYKPEKAEKVE